jgi:hypothetical protein
MASATAADAEKLGELAELLEQALAERPPAFGLAGVSGVGKSSTSMRYSVLSCRRATPSPAPRNSAMVPLGVEYSSVGGTRRQMALTVIDAQGLGDCRAGCKSDIFVG